MDHEGPEGEYRYSTTLSLTLVLDGVGGQRHAPTTLPLGMTRYPLYRRGPGSIWTDAENLAPNRDSIPGPSSRSKSLYRQCYPGPQKEKDPVSRCISCFRMLQPFTHGTIMAKYTYLNKHTM